MSTLYISGPMTGFVQHNYPAFFEAEDLLVEAGFVTLNPARHPIDGRSWEDYLRRDISDVLVSTGVATLPGWENSRGATLEVYIARSLSMPVFNVQDWIARSIIAEAV